MKKIFLIGLFFLAACTTAMPEPTATPLPTVTRVTPTDKPATATTTITPLPSATPTLIPPERYFTKEFDSPMEYWSILYASGDASSVDMRNENSALTFELSSPNTWMYAVYNPFDYDRVHIGISAISFGNDVNAMGLICHYSDQEGWYEFNISSDGSYNVLYGQWLADSIARYTPITDGTSDYIQTGSITNIIGLDCGDNFLRLYINDQLFRTLNVENIGLTGGKVGLTLASFDQVPVVLSFDWVEV